MAKQPINIVERHAEKGVLGICAAVLVASIVLFLVSTPNKVDLDGEMVGPNAIDQHIRDAGQSLASRLRNAQTDKVTPKDFTPELRAAADPIAFAGLAYELPPPIPWLPRVPDIGDAPPRAGEIRLATVLAPMQLRVAHGRSTLYLQPAGVLGGNAAQGGGQQVPPTAVNWVTVAAVFDQQQQIEVCKKAGYIAGRRNPYVVGVDMQRREKLPDGTTTEWQDVKPYAPLELPGLPSVEIIQGRKGLIASEPTRDRVRKFFGLLRASQADLMRPLFPEWKYGDEWLYPKWPDISVEVLDKELCIAGGDCDPRGYPLQTDLVPQEVEAKTPADLLQDALAEAETLVRLRQWDAAIKKAGEAKKMDGVRANDTSRANKIIDDAEQGKRDEEKGRLPTDENDGVDDPADIRRSRYQVVWGHDAAEGFNGGTVSGRIYQYRMRVRLYNRFTAVPGDLADGNDAKQVFVAGDWSAPSEDVYILPDTRFFLTRGDTNLKSGARVTVFTWFEGVWVSHDFPIAAGQFIRDASRQTVRVDDRGNADRPLVPFDADCTVVDIDYDYMYSLKKERRQGFTIDVPKRTVALVYSDASGALHQRILAADRRGAEYKTFRDMVPKFTSTRRR